MILRYFYIDKYHELAEDLNINFGGKYCFHYNGKDFSAKENKAFVHKLYRRYSVISDVSAIIGKNGSGKTTILRIINYIFNNFLGDTNIKYILCLEDDSNNYKILSNIDLNPPIDSFIVEYSSSTNITNRLKELGIIYYSDIFDRASPFIGNSNILDISMNYEFSKFISEDETNTEDILNEYRARCVLQEINFLISLNREFKDSDIELLFPMPKQIEIGFIAEKIYNFEIHDTPNTDKTIVMFSKVCENVTDYFTKNENIDKKNYINEILSFFLLEELYQELIRNEYNISSALECWQNKIQSNNWETIQYFDEIINKLVEENDLEEETDNYVNVISDTYDDVLEQIDDILQDLLTLDSLDLHNVKWCIEFLNKFFSENSDHVNIEILNELKNCSILIAEIEDDLLTNDYDLLNINMIFNICESLKKIFDRCIIDFGRIEIYGFIEGSVSTEATKKKKGKIYYGLTDEMKQFIDLKNKFVMIVQKSNFNEDLIQTDINDQEILEFIYSFQNITPKLLEIEVRRRDISSGQTSYMDMCSRLNLARKSGEIKNKSYVLLLIDEGDVYLHPEMQLTYINNLLNIVQIMFQGKKVQIIITANSPFIISDIQSNNIVCLQSDDKNNKSYVEKNLSKITTQKLNIGKTFAANINDLLLDSFFVKQGLIGQFSISIIEQLIKEIRGEIQNVDKEFSKSIIGIIGEPIIRRKLEQMYFGISKHNTVDEEINYYKQMVEKLKADKETNG